MIIIDEFIKECPVCFLPLMFPLQQCTNGHFLCNLCYDKTIKCAICRCCLKKKARNLLAERLCIELDTLIRCNKCHMSINAKSINEHEQFCSKNLHTCACGWSGLNEELWDHFTDFHDIVVNNSNGKWNIIINDIHTDTVFCLLPTQNSPKILVVYKSYKNACCLYFFKSNYVHDNIQMCVECESNQCSINYISNFTNLRIQYIHLVTESAVLPKTILINDESIMKFKCKLKFLM